MPLGGLSSSNIVQIVLFLLPGLVGVKAALWKAHRADWLNRIDTVGVSFLLSLFSMGVLYIYQSWSAVTCAVLSFSLRNCAGFLSLANISTRAGHLPDALVYYGGLYVISIATGILFGGVYYHVLRSGERIPRKNLWPYYFRGIRNSGAESRIERLREIIQIWEQRLFSKSDGDSYYVRVHTTDGRAIDGKIDQEGQVSQKRDVVLQDPTILKLDGGEEETLDDWTGSAYIHEQGISYVQFDELGSADSTPRKRRPMDGSSSRDEEERKGGSTGAGLNVEVSFEDIDPEEDPEITDLEEKLEDDETEESTSKD